jgi:hypothetical protein
MTARTQLPFMGNPRKLLAETVTATVDELLDFYLKDSFMLPPEVIRRAKELGWMIPNIQLVPADEFLQAAPLLEDMTAIRYEPSYELVLYSKQVGVSIRKHTARNILHVLVKTWT